MINTGIQFGVLISSALVMLMTPGLRLFYGGMVRKWILYSLAFDPDKLGIIGNLKYLGLKRE